LAGFVLGALGVGWAYTFDALSFLSTIVALVLMRNVPTHNAGAPQEVSLRAAVAGLRFVFAAPLIRSSMLLDFFATFFSSATALLPIFVQDILKVGPSAYGLLYAAPAVGAAITSIAMVKLTDRIEHRGYTMVGAVLVYGLATVMFGISQHYALTFACLAITGAADTVSVVMRNLVRHLATPDHLRGRMTSVNMIFFMGGPQLGELEAGLIAHWAGAPFSVISGGIACIIATIWVAVKTPPLRRYRREDPLITSQPIVAEGISK
jgi:predicted MFS family arabinose efflux permease